MRQETLALIESALDAAGAEGLARAAAAEELTQLVERAAAIETAELRAALREFFTAEAAVAALYHPNGIYTDFYEAADIANAARENLRRLAGGEVNHEGRS